MQAIIQRFSANRNGAAAVEFALVSGLMIMTILFVLIVALIQFVGQSLDYAAQKAARQVMTGAVQSVGMSQTLFRTSVVCPLLPASLNCNNVIVNLYTVPQGSQPNGYYAFTNGGNAGGLVIPPMSNASAQYSLGIQGQYQYLLIVYPITFIPSVFTSMLGTSSFQGQAAYPVMATAAFRNEQY